MPSPVKGESALTAIVKVSFSKTVAPSILKPIVVWAVAVPVTRKAAHPIHKQEAMIYLINLFICINFILVSGTVSSRASMTEIEIIEMSGLSAMRFHLKCSQSVEKDPVAMRRQSPFAWIVYFIRSFFE